MSIFEEQDPIFNEENQTRLMQEIKSAPDCEIYGVSKYNQRSIKIGIAGSILSSLILILISIALTDGLFTVMILGVIITGTLVACAILSYMNYSHKYFKTYISSLGISKDSKWDEGALPWEKIEYLEIKEKNNEIDYIRFWSGVCKLGYRNSRFVRRLSLVIINEFLGGLNNWTLVEDINEITKSDKFYIRPDIDESTGRQTIKKLLLMEWIGEEDFDADQTQEQPSAKSDEMLYDLILNDPQCEIIIKQGRISKLFSNWKSLLSMLILAILASIYGMFEGPYAPIAFILVVILVIHMLIGVFFSVTRNETLVMSPIGIVRHYLGSPEALEWQYVEFIDFDTVDDQVIPFEFFGNKTRILCPRHIYKSKITWDHIARYLPDLSEWTRTTQYDWGEGIFRLIRPTA
jgi:hypothetical protein